MPATLPLPPTVLQPHGRRTTRWAGFLLRVTDCTVNIFPIPINSRSAAVVLFHLRVGEQWSGRLELAPRRPISCGSINDLLAVV